MTTRRDFLQTTAGALAGIAFVGCDVLAAAPARAQGRRREVVVNGKRAKTVDVHAHCAVPEALALMGLKIGGAQLRPGPGTAAEGAARRPAMGEEGIDVAAPPTHPHPYKAARGPAQPGGASQDAQAA